MAKPNPSGCCRSEDCCCTRIKNSLPPVTMTAKVIGPGCPIDGATAQMVRGAAGPDECDAYVITGGWSHDCDPPAVMGLRLSCLEVQQESCRGYRLTMTPGNSACKSLASNQNVAPSSCRCGDGTPGNKFQGLFDGFCLETADWAPPGQCDCCCPGGGFTIQIDEN